jgi:hypothetical protein
VGGRKKGEREGDTGGERGRDSERERDLYSSLPANMIVEAAVRVSDIPAAVIANTPTRTPLTHQSITWVCKRRSG